MSVLRVAFVSSMIVTSLIEPVIGQDQLRTNRHISTSNEQNIVDHD